MSTSSGVLFETFLNQHDDEAWAEVMDSLLPLIHEVDQTATRIWFHFYPLALARALQQSDDPAALANKLVLQGRYRLTDQIDSSHAFLYGHRYWPQVKQAIIAHANSSSVLSGQTLTEQIKHVAQQVSNELNQPFSLFIGITAVGFMTVQQVGLSAFMQADGAIRLPQHVAARSPQQVLACRARDDRQGWLAWFKYPDKVWTITFDENDPHATFKLINSQHLTTAAAHDKRPYHLRDSRCIINEGPIPVQCRAGSCGTCWVGVLGGAEKLSPVSSFERQRMKEFGYIDTDEEKPIIRLACQAQAYGAVSIVIPPWSGVLGRYLRQRQRASANIG
ncbi:MAG: 2Fe-2S iron-sulfur cluster-binding protein [Acidobacteriota bacterium]|nr:(2Fe-2S)-binding protein [Blastocatellia bacterium]MDW8240822.1 2Fe-2S iron-sulfur cluster-binding protein [Acidobacteriota bacterium]